MVFGQIDLKDGIWRAELALSDTTVLPFNFDIGQVNGETMFFIQNGSERIIVSDIQQLDDGELVAKMPVFDSAIKTNFTENGMDGYWYNYAKGDDYRIPFTAKYGDQYRFKLERKPNSTTKNITGRWEVIFGVGTENTSEAIGEFSQIGQRVVGTFLTPTGDYRYLEGIVENNQLKLSCFDGSHAFLFQAEMTEDGQSMKGDFWSGSHWHEQWTAKKNDAAVLPDPDKLTFLKEGYEAMAFSFPNLSGEMVSLDDPKYQDKVVLIQILGSWCPNCMDETAFYTQAYKKYQDQGLEIIGLAFERNPDLAVSKPILEKYIQQMGIDYELLLAGRASKKEAAEVLPMLNHVLSFPTTIFVDRKGKVRKIHTGFSGPATSEYPIFTQKFTQFVESLLKE